MTSWQASQRDHFSLASAYAFESTTTKHLHRGRGHRVNPHCASFDSVLTCAAGSSSDSLREGGGTVGVRSTSSVIAWQGQASSGRLTAPRSAAATVPSPITEA